MKEFFIAKAFNEEALGIVAKCNEIIVSYSRQGYDLSLRQLYYQLVARNIVENTERSYKRIGNIISDARLAGLVDWDMISDRGRETIINPHWDHPGEILNSAANSFKMDLWTGQRCHVEVMVEKQALEGVLTPVCRRWDIPFTANKGYSSSSALYEAGKRLGRIRSRERKVLHVLYLGDHDPSGLDMTRDVEERLSLFARCTVNVQRLALNRDQIDELDPPENPAKLTDSRASAYVEEHGYSSWELDAIEPAALSEIVDKAVQEFVNIELWNERKAQQETYRRELNRLSNDYTEKAEAKAMGDADEEDDDEQSGEEEEDDQ